MKHLKLYPSISLFSILLSALLVSGCGSNSSNGSNGGNGSQATTVYAAGYTTSSGANSAAEEW